MADDAASIETRNDALDRQAIGSQIRLPGNWNLTASAERAQKAAFRGNRSPSGSMIQHLKDTSRVVIFSPAHNAQCTLADSGNHDIVVKDLCDAMSVTEPFQTGHGEDDSVKFAGR